MKTLNIFDGEHLFKQIASEFQMSTETVLYESIIAFLEKNLREIHAEFFKICDKYKIQNIHEFENLYKEGKIEEADSREDYQNLDVLEYKKEAIEKILKELQ